MRGRSIRSKRLRRPNSPVVRINYHINADSLIRGNREWLGLRADVPACASLCAALHIQNVIARRQHSTIISVRVCDDPRDFFLFVPAQDEQRIISIVFRRHDRRVFIAEIDPPGRKDLQMTLHETLRFRADPCAAGKQKNDEGRNEVSKEDRPEHKKIGGIDFNLSRLFRKPPFTARSGYRHCGRVSPHRAPG
jgi:hypothetical protein